MIKIVHSNENPTDKKTKLKINNTKYDFMNRFVYIFKQYNVRIFISSFIFTIGIFALNYHMDSLRLRSILYPYASEIITLINEDDPQIYENLETKINSVYYEKVLFDKSFAFEVYACPNYYKSYTCSYPTPIFFKNNTNVIYSKSNDFKIKIGNKYLFINNYPMISVKLSVLFNKVNFDIYFYKSTLIFFNSPIYLGFLFVFMFGFLIIFLFLYYFSEYKYLTAISNTINLIKHEFQTITNIIIDLKFPIKTKSLLFKKFKIINDSLLKFNSPNYIDSQSLKNMLENFQSYYLEHTVIIHPINFTGRYKIPQNNLNIAISNIIDNAFSAPSLASKVEIFTEVSQSNSLVVKIINNGNKMPEDVRLKLFKFHVTFGKTHGHGNALYEIRIMLSKSNSTIDAPKSDKETEFVIEIFNHIKYIDKSISEKENINTEAKKLSKLILIDDEYFYIEMLLNKLSDHYEIEYCLSPEDFIEKIEKNYFVNINEYNIISDFYFRGDVSNQITYDSVNLYSFLRKNNYNNLVIVFSSADKPKTNYDYFAEKNKDGVNKILDFLQND